MEGYFTPTDYFDPEHVEKIGFRVHNVRFYNFFLNLENWLIPQKWLAIYCERLNKYKLSSQLGRNFIIVVQKI